MTPREYISLYEKCNAGNCTANEKKLLEEYLDNFKLTEGEWTAGMGTKEEVRSAIYNKLQESIGVAPVKKLTSARYWIAAASVILALSISLFLFKDKKTGGVQVKAPTAYLKHDILPGSNKAILTLSNGSKIVLGNSGSGTLTRQGQVTVNKLNNGQLVYSVNDKSAESAALFNTATTPKGGQYELILSDGTKVWLNAASSLKYPVVFSGNERHVELTGEAYFEVAKNKKMPFLVTTKKNSIQVLGTHFNVMAYDDDDNMVTTLLEGSVKLKKESAEVLLKPGQQAVLADGQASYRVSEVNTDEAVAWKNGYFIFDNENIQSIMKRIARWYDVDVKYNGTVKDQDFGGTVSRFSNVSELLRVLELTGTIHFKIEGRAITVMP